MFNPATQHRTLRNQESFSGVFTYTLNKIQTQKRKAQSKSEPNLTTDVGVLTFSEGNEPSVKGEQEDEYEYHTPLNSSDWGDGTWVF